VITSTLNLLTGEVVLQESHPRPDDRPQAAQQQQRPEIIERIDFIGNRRVRNDTLKARIFSRENDVYNEETLRRIFGFQIPILRTCAEESPDRADARSLFLKGTSDHPHPLRQYSLRFESDSRR
jgi:hypothetical protein